MKYKLIALDLDGTIIGRDLQISPATKAAVARARSEGVMVTLATGRMFRATLPFAREMSLSTPLICYQGAMIKHPVSQQELFHRCVPLETARQVISVLRDMGHYLNVYVDDELYVAKVTTETERYTSLSRVVAHPVGDLLEFLRVDPTKLVVVCQPDVTDGLVLELNRQFGDRLFITKSYPIFCEIANLGCGKGPALSYLAEYLGIKREETVAIGDNLNDVDMVQWAGLGVAMAQSPPELLDVADWVTGSLAEDGAAAAIEKLLEL